MCTFRQALVADLSGGIDLELLRYGASICRAITRGTAVLTAAGARSSRAFASVVERVFETEHGLAPIVRLLPEPDLNTLLSMVRALESDVILVRYSHAKPHQRELARRLLCDAPCSVWLIPEGYTGGVTRVAAAFDPDSSGATLLGLAARVTRALHAECLTAVNVWFPPTVLDPADEIEEEDTDRQLALYRFIQPVNLHGVACHLRAECGPSASRRLVEVGRANGTDLLVFTAPEVTSVGFILRRDGVGTYLASGMPLLAVRMDDGKCARRVWHDLFGESEPAFS